MPTDPNQMLTATLTSEIWDHICDRLGDYADQAEERPWLGDCFDCDTADPGMCSQHQEAAEYGAQVRAWRDQIVEQLAGPPEATLAELIERTGLPLDSDIRDVMPGLSTRAMNCLLRERIYTLGDLAARTDDNLLDIRNIGVGSLAEIKIILLALAVGC
ncbi:DNA-directed RNA polymerase subunit alpha C-terminal domain-containing protein [Nonomuraea sp. M3C6]|uniref:DNA-directed RNA polymerase subunit alpha C-terminal domain-containing protein n=1 Tax=Nonomuraea marmarensis TaxID=3351344 RepID=A0ABW7AP18_9ACTN